MQDNNITTRQGQSPRMTIRVSKGSLIFAIADTDHPNDIIYEPYTAKSGVSMAANLREAFKTADILQRPTHRAQVLVDTPVVLIPIEEYDETKNEILYHQAVTGYDGYAVESNILPDLNAEFSVCRIHPGNHKRSFLMLGDIRQAKNVYIVTGYTDMRKGIRSLVPYVMQNFKMDPYESGLFW